MPQRGGSCSLACRTASKLTGFRKFRSRGKSPLHDHYGCIKKLALIFLLVGLLTFTYRPSSAAALDEVPESTLENARIAVQVQVSAGHLEGFTIEDRGSGRILHDPAPLQILAVESNRLESDVPYSVPLYAGVRLYLQFLPEENQAKVIREIRRSLGEFQRSDPFFDHTRSHGIRFSMAHCWGTKCLWITLLHRRCVRVPGRHWTRSRL